MSFQLAGTVVGYYFFGPIGAAIGGAIGGAIDGSMRKSDGSGVDTRIQTSEYGRPIPIIYSVAAVGGNIIWAADLVKTGDGGGKGGGDSSSTGPTYAANFAILICESDGDHNLGKIWAGPDKRLVYDPATAQIESGSITYYNGAGDQMPDPLMEAALGAGNVPAYRGFAYVVFEGFDVSAHDGNRIPFLTIEMGVKGDPVEPSDAPENLGIVWFDRMIDGGDNFIATYNGTYSGVIQRSKADMSMVHHRVLGGWEAGQIIFYDIDRDTLIRQRSNDTAGSYDTLVIGTDVLVHRTAVLGIESGAQAAGSCMANDNYVFAFNRPAAGGIRFYTVNPATNTLSTTQTFDTGGSALQFLYGADPSYPWVWGVTLDGNVRRFDLDGSSTASEIVGVKPAAFLGGADGRYDPYRNLLWMASRTSLVTGEIFYSVVSSIAQVSFGSVTTVFAGLAGWIVEPDAVYLFGSRWLAVDHYLSFELATYTPTTEEDGVYVGTADMLQAAYNDVTGKVVALRYGGSYAISTTSDPATIPTSSGYMGGAEPGVGGGSSTLLYLTLAEVVTDLCLRAGLTEDQIDVTDLADDQVDGYVIGNQTSVKDAIAALMPVHFFDAAEDQGKVIFVKRGGGIAVEIPEDDLGAHPSGSQPTDLMPTTRGMDEELPGTLAVNYTLAATKYSQASKYDRKRTGHSSSEMSMDLSMVLSDQKALEVASVNLHEAWVSRLTYAPALSRKYAFLMPTDVIGVTVGLRGYTMRITKMKQTDNGFFQCEAEREDSTGYEPIVIVTETPPDPGTIGAQPLTLLELM